MYYGSLLINHIVLFSRLYNFFGPICHYNNLAQVRNVRNGMIYIPTKMYELSKQIFSNTNDITGRFHNSKEITLRV